MAEKKRGTDKLPFGKVLKQISTDRKLTVRALAEMAGVSASVIQSWLNGAIPHDLQAVARLATALNISFKALLLGQSEQFESDASPLFDEQDLFDGICRVKIQRLTPKKKS